MSTSFAREGLIYTFAQSHSDEDWIHPLPDVVEAVSAETAAWKPADGVPSIWELTLHATQYLEALADDLEGRTPPETEDWPTPGDQGAQSWAVLQRRTREAASRVASAIERKSEQDLSARQEGRQKTTFQRVADIAIHDAYHAGQIVKLRQLYEAAISDRAAALVE